MSTYTGIDSFTNSELTDIFPVLLRFAKIADSLAEGMVASQSFQRDTVAQEMCEIIRELSGAEVASCRAVGLDEQTDLIAQAWMNEDHFGEIPLKKHRDDCKTRITSVEGGVHTKAKKLLVKERRKDSAHEVLFYSDSEREHFRQLGSEAIIPLTVGTGIPKAMLVLGHRDSKFFDEKKIAQLDSLRGFFNGFFQMADLAEDRYEKQLLLRRVANEIPQILKAPSKLAFYRAICALLTCSKGFEFDRAMYFSMHGGQLPAMCEMAVGGIGNDWPRQREALDRNFGSLRSYLDDAHEFPKPGDSPRGKPDTLYAAACSDNPMTLRRGDSPVLEEFLRTGRDKAGRSVLKLTHDDPWIARQHKERDELFLNSNNEFFVFALRPLGQDGATDLMGFVVADLPYRAQTHQPGLGFPDLGMCDFLLKLLTALCYFTDDAQSYFHVLKALPDLRHSGDAVIHAIEDFRDSLGGLEKLSEEQLEFYQTLEHHGRRVSRAKHLIEKVKNGQAADTEDLFAIVTEVAQSSEKRYQNNVNISVDLSLLRVAADIQRDDLVSILECLFDNAVTHGWRGASVAPKKRWIGRVFSPSEPQKQVNIKVSVRQQSVQVKAAGRQYRLLLEISNDGAIIPVENAPFIFSDGVTSNVELSNGTGLSSARQVARAFAGDVVLLTTAPVKFGVVLVPRKEVN